MVGAESDSNPLGSEEGFRRLSGTKFPRRLWVMRSSPTEANPSLPMDSSPLACSPFLYPSPWEFHAEGLGPRVLSGVVTISVTLPGVERMDSEETEKKRRRGRINERTKHRVVELYRQGLSPRQVEDQLGISDTTVWRILVKNGEPRRNMSQAKMKYPKTDFSGDLAEQARIIGFIEDCWVGYNRKQVRVQTGTTQPAQIELFDEYFGRYGHVTRYPGYNQQFSLYQWQLYVDLNPSFQFLIEYKKNPMKFLAETRYEYICIGSQADAEGWVGIEFNKGYPLPALSIRNNNRQLLAWTQRIIGGSIDSDHDGHHQLRLFGKEVVEALRIIPIRHREKVAAKELILHHADNGGIGMESLKEYRELRQKIDDDVQLFTLQARLEWIRRHGKPHRYDPDQTVPQNLNMSTSSSSFNLIYRYSEETSYCRSELGTY